MKEFVEHGRVDGSKEYTYEGALRRIKSLINSDPEMRSAISRRLSEDDIIEIGFNYYGFDYINNN